MCMQVWQYLLAGAAAPESRRLLAGAAGGVGGGRRVCRVVAGVGSAGLSACCCRGVLAGGPAAPRHRTGAPGMRPTRSCPPVAPAAHAASASASIALLRARCDCALCAHACAPTAAAGAGARACAHAPARRKSFALILECLDDTEERPKQAFMPTRFALLPLRSLWWRSQDHKMI